MIVEVDVGLLLRLSLLAFSVVIFLFGYFYFDEKAEYRIVPAVVYFISGIIFCAGSAPVLRKSVPRRP